MGGKPTLSRPKTRTLVRWDDNLNELLLLTIQSVCNAQSIKIPWGDVARTMKHNATEGAIVQHLAKLRTRRVAAGKAVPPPLRRGAGGGSGPSRVSEPVSMGKKTKTSPVEGWGTSDEEWLERRAPQGRSSRRKATPKRKAPKYQYMEAANIDSQEAVDDDDGDLLVPGAKFLELPNDRYQREVSSSSSSSSSSSGSGTKNSEPRKSKIIVLKYRKQCTPPKTMNEFDQTFEHSFAQSAAAQENFTANLGFSSDMETETKYVPAGISELDLPPIGYDALSGPGTYLDIGFNGTLESLQQPLSSFQDMLGEYMNLDALNGFGGMPEDEC